jgi:NAD(P)-dependent dehydrogenase (short-subunit alcohol dehydrogenase family)
MDFESVRAAGETVVTKYGASGIHVLCCNAGIMAFADEATKDGFDVQMQTNHLSHFLLTSIVFPLLERGAEAGGEGRGQARIVNHSSLARHEGELLERYLQKNGGNLGGNSASMLCGGARWKRYGQTKLANSIFTQGLCRRLAGKNSQVIAVCAAPGLAQTHLQVTSLGVGGMTDGCCGSMCIMGMAQSPADGALGILFASFMPTVTSGDLYEPGGTGIGGLPVKVKLTKTETSVAHDDMLWAASEVAIGGKFL